MDAARTPIVVPKLTGTVSRTPDQEASFSIVPKDPLTMPTPADVLAQDSTAKSTFTPASIAVPFNAFNEAVPLADAFKQLLAAQEKNGGALDFLNVPITVETRANTQLDVTPPPLYPQATVDVSNRDSKEMASFLSPLPNYTLPPNEYTGPV